MFDHQDDMSIPGLTLRSFEARDQQVVSHLYDQGLLAGQIAPNDSGADIDNMREAYFDNERHHFWVAELEGKVIAMIGVVSDETHTAEIRRLRVDPAHQQTTIASTLLETAIAHCKHHGYLKVRLDTQFERDAAVGLFDHVGFQHTRTKSMHGKDLLEFYLDLYRPDKPDGE
jgi:N-acetylglutamate synthase-like GNAT family acetyltransferase